MGLTARAARSSRRLSRTRTTGLGAGPAPISHLFPRKHLSRFRVLIQCCWLGRDGLTDIRSLCPRGLGKPCGSEHITIWLLTSCYFFNSVQVFRWMWWRRCRLSVSLHYFHSFINSLLTHSTLGTSPDCTTAFHQPSDTFVQVACQQDNVSYAISQSGRNVLTEVMNVHYGLCRLIWLSRSVISSLNTNPTVWYQILAFPEIQREETMFPL